MASSLEFNKALAAVLTAAPAIGGQSFTSWDIPWQGHRIWGATAGMLVSFGELLSDP